MPTKQPHRNRTPTRPDPQPFHPTDGRLVLVGLTASGLELIDRAVADHAANESHIIAGLSPRQRQQLTALLRVLLQSVESPVPPT